MTGTSAIELYYDPFDSGIDDNPYPVWQRMREEAPLYYNEKYNFYALSRYEDVARELPNWQTYRSGRGTTADILFSNVEVPPGILLFETAAARPAPPPAVARLHPAADAGRGGAWCADSVSVSWTRWWAPAASISSGIWGR